MIAPRLIVPDLNLDYPFMDGDSWDWIANGLRFAGADVRFSGRPPLLPVLIAGLDRLSALSWLPALLQVLFLGTVLAFYRLAACLAPRRAAFAAALALLLNHSVQGLAVQVMADLPASCLLFFAVRSFLLAGWDDAPRRYLTSGIWGASAALAQPAALLSALAAGLAVLARRRQDLRSPWLAAGVAVLVGVPLLGLWLERRLAAPGDPLLLHERLLHPHHSIVFYLWSLASLFGPAGALLLAAGLVAAVREARRDAARLFLVLLIAVLLGFFVFFYDFNAERFLALLVWPAGLLMADALGRLRPGPAFAGAAALLVLGAAQPLPGLGNDPSWIALWPLPPVYASAGLAEGSAAGSPRLDFGALSIQRLSPADLVRFSLPYRVWSARPERTAAADRLSPEEVAADRNALFLAADPGDGGGRYRTLTRLGNTLRKKVTFVPADRLLPWLPRLAVTPIRTIAPDYAVFRARLPGLPDSWLLVTSFASPIRQTLEMTAGATAPFDPDLQSGLTRALAVRRLTAGSDGYVALFPAEGDPLELYLPFVLDTTELYVIEPQDAPEAHRLLDAAPLLREDRIGRTLVRRIVYMGRKAAVVTETEEPRR